METTNVFIFLISITYVTVQRVVLAENNESAGQSFSNYLKSLQDETGYLCSYIREKSTVTTKDFLTLIQDAHIHCPNLEGKEVSLINIAAQAEIYHGDVTKQLSTCEALLYMLMKSLDNAGLVDYYLKEGDYSLVTSIIDKWHQSFLKFRSQFHVTDTPLDIILSLKKIFFYDNCIVGNAESVLTLIFLLISSLVVLKVLIWTSLITCIVTLFSPPSTYSRQRKSSTDHDSSENDASETNSDSDDRQHRKAKQKHKLASRKIDRVELASKTAQSSERHAKKYSTASISPKFYTTVMIIVWLTVLGGLIVLTVLWYPSKISFSKSTRYNWYPDATAVMENMKIHRERIKSDISHRIHSIEKLQRYASMYHDQTIQANVDSLISSLATGIRQASKEVSDLYVSSKEMPSAFRQAYRNIETKAKKAGRLVEANNLLAELKKTYETYEKFQRYVRALMINQRKLLPTLKEQTQGMRALVEKGHIREINRISKGHIHTIIDIDGYFYNVTVVVKQLFRILNDDSYDGMKNAVEELKDQTISDQYKRIIYGAVGGIGGSLSGAVAGTVAIKSGYALVSVTATAIAGPIAAAIGGVGLLGIGAYSLITNFEQYQDAAYYKTELEAVEARRQNLYIAMKNFQKAVSSQQSASEATQKALDNIVTHSASFSDVLGFTLPTPKRIALSNELLHIVQQYNSMINTLNSFESYAPDDNEKLVLE